MQPQMTNTKVKLNFILKVVSRCNLNCDYCYVYHKGDQSWRLRPTIMSDEVFRSTVQRIRRHCLHSGQSSVQIVFHGGEPCLAGSEQLSKWFRLARNVGRLG